MKHTYVFDDGRPNVVHEVATMDDLRLAIATYEALQSELDELKAEVALLKEAMHQANLRRCEACGDQIDKAEMRGDDEDGYRCFSCISDATRAEVLGDGDD